MRPAQKARRLLSGRWITAVAVQSIVLAASMLVLMIELVVLRFSHLGAETIAHINDFFDGEWTYGAVTIGTLLLDWLLISPLLLGQSLYFWKVAEGEEVSYSALFAFYLHGYRRALHWRLSLFLRRLLWTTVCYMPAALIMGYAEIVRQSGSDTPFTDIMLLFCTLVGFLSLLAGFLVSEMLMLRYVPATYFTALSSDEPIHEIYRQSCRLMKGHVGDLFWVTIGFIGWFLSCFLIFPYFYVAPLFQTTRVVVIRQYIADMLAHAKHNPNATRLHAKQTHHHRKKVKSTKPINNI